MLQAIAQVGRLVVVQISGYEEGAIAQIGVTATDIAGNVVVVAAHEGRRLGVAKWF